ncbi:MAG: hypothetical protein HF978_06410 [Desulfobacteraceae bacterium]|nr:hypothetical protein [Desulfobacteraceae bacterium]MBC2755163.1 hypothetical protein [Desulfobacteraceae bacterium]
MASPINFLEPFDRLHIGPFISKYSDWILFTLLLFLFWAVAGIALRKRFEDSRHLRILVTSVALLLSVGTYYSIYEGWLHLSLEGFGLFGAAIVFIVIFFIIFGAIRAYGMRLSNALPLGFLLFFVSLWAISPNMFHTLNEKFPLANTLLGLLFLVSLFKIIAAFFMHSGPKPSETAKDLRRVDIETPENEEIDREIAEEKEEKKILKKRTLRFTKIEIKSIDNIEECLKRIISLIKENGNSLTREEVAGVSKYLKEISKNENIIKSSLKLIKKHLNSYQSLHRKDISELEDRMKKTKSEKKQKIIEEEILYQQKMLQVIDFMKSYESKIVLFTDTFNKLLSASMQKLKTHHPNDALNFLVQAYKEIMSMKHIFKKQKEFEKFLIKLNKKTVSNLKKEKDPE